VLTGEAYGGPVWRPEFVTPPAYLPIMIAERLLVQRA
jgi:hypothetical protein